MSVNLIIDIGNSLLKVALVQGDIVLEQHSCLSLSEDVVNDIQARYPSMSRAIVASTAHTTAEVASTLRKCGIDVLEMNSLTPIPIGNDYLSPETLGVDRLAAAVGAVEVMGCADALIVDFGTAITIDMVESGVFRGGNISPGMRTRFRALHDYTSRLPECEATDEILRLGRTTRQAIEQGVMEGITHEIRGYISSFSQQNENLTLIFTGGDANFFVKRIKNAIFAKCDLVLCGLNRILEYNAEL